MGAMTRDGIKTVRVADNTWSVFFRGKELHDYPSEAHALRAACEDLQTQVAFAYFLLERTQADLEQATDDLDASAGDVEVLADDVAMLARALDHAAKQLGLTSKEELLALARKKAG